MTKNLNYEKNVHAMKNYRRLFIFNKIAALRREEGENTKKKDERQTTGVKGSV